MNIFTTYTQTSSMKITGSVIYALLAVYMISCSHGKEKTKNTQQQTAEQTIPQTLPENFEKGKALSPIFIKEDSTQSYALYLPSSYSLKNKYPVIYFFDPHAAGYLPVNKYKELAEKYGYILIGCNNSENGMQWENTNLVVRNMMHDSKTRISIDPGRIYTGGFSGGSRIASNTAIMIGGINGVIACGAGLGTEQQPIQKFSFLGIAGNEDFNYTELKDLDKSFNNSNWAHFFLEFDGKHEWPPVETMENAFVWLELNAMRDKLITKNDSMIKNFVAKNERDARKFESEKKTADEYKTLKKTAVFTAGLISDSTRSKKIKKMESGKELQEILRHKNELENREEAMKRTYAENMQTKNDTWWTGEVKKLSTEIKMLNDKEEILIRKRVLNYLSLVAYMNTSNAIHLEDLKTATHFITIYKLVDPGNPDHAYLEAIVFANKNEPDKALQCLRECVKLGYKDYKKMSSEKDFEKLNREYHEFGELLTAVKENAEK